MIQIAAVGALMLPSPVSAQATATGTVLLGLMTVDGPRPSLGVAFGYSSVAGFEIEYTGALGGSPEHSSVGGIFGNAIVHPMTIGNFQFFAIGGFGMWGEKFADGTGTGLLSATDFGGVKMKITEHLRLRLDYRLFLLGDPEEDVVPSTTHPQRWSAGLHLVF